MKETIRVSFFYQFDNKIRLIYNKNVKKALDIRFIFMKI